MSWMSGKSSRDAQASSALPSSAQTDASKNWASERGDDAVSEESFEEDVTNVINATKTKTTQSAARKLFALSKLKKPTVPKKSRITRIKENNPHKIYESSRALETGSARPRGRSFSKQSFDESDDDTRAIQVAVAAPGKYKPKTPSRSPENQPASITRGASLVFADRASRMRRSIRMNDSIMKRGEMDEHVSAKGTVVFKQKRNTVIKPRNKVYDDRLISRLHGIAAKLNGVALMKAKLLQHNCFWSLGQIIHVYETETNVIPTADHTPLDITKYFKLYTAMELCRNVDEMHSRSNFHGHLSSEAVLFDRNLNVALRKAKTVRVKGQFSLKRLQNDILQSGVIMLELFCKRRVGPDFCPSASKAQELEVTLGDGRMTKYSGRSSRKSMRRNKLPKVVTFTDIESKIFDEVLSALNKVGDLREQEELKDIIKRCFCANPDQRPLATQIRVILKNSLDNYVTSEDLEDELELIKILNSIIASDKLMSQYIRGPRLVDFNQYKKIEKKNELANTRRSIRDDHNADADEEPVPEAVITSKPGYITDDSFYVEDGDNESVVSEVTKDRDIEDIEKRREEAQIRDRLLAKGVNNKKKTMSPKRKKTTKHNNKLLGFLKSQGNISNKKVKEMAQQEETQSNFELSSTPPPRSTVKKKKMNLSAFSTLNKNVEEDDEYERPRAESMEDLEQQQKVHSEVKANVKINFDNLHEFQNEWAAKKEARKLKKNFDPNVIRIKSEHQERLPMEVGYAILERATAMLRNEPNMLTLEGPVTIVGDIHGQFFDLCNLMSKAGDPGTEIGEINGKKEYQTYLFLGDYVDRGNFSCEVLFYILSLKLRHNANVWLLRGNHESKATSGYFGFREECEKKYGSKMYLKCCEVFQAMPIAALINTHGGRFLCLHGGISSNVRTLDQFTEFDRFQEPIMYGFLCDVLWADPMAEDDDENTTGGDDDDDDEEEEEDGEDTVKKHTEKALGLYFKNPLRGCSFRFGLTALREFLKKNNLVSIIRGHQVQQEGYCFHFQELTFKYFPQQEPNARTPEEICPPIITVFSAPNYCGKYGNKGAFLNLFQRPAEQVDDYDPEEVKFDPLSLLDPVEFKWVKEPKLVKLPEYHQKQTLDIETICPYMPTGFAALINKTLSLQTSDMIKVISDDAHKKWETAKANSKFKDLEDIRAASERKRVNFLKKRNNSIRRPKEMTVITQADGADGQLGKWQGLAKTLNRKEEKAHKIYETARKQDRINEMNPVNLQNAQEKAAKKMENTTSDDFNLPGMIALVKDGGKGSAAERRTRASFNLNKLQEEKEVSFERKELITLQTLFLLIDHEETGTIGPNDLMKWSESAGGTIRSEEADLVVNILDFDKDGTIGFEDYLVFAAACKKTWLAEQLAEIITGERRKKESN